MQITLFTIKAIASKAARVTAMTRERVLNVIIGCGSGSGSGGSSLAKIKGKSNIFKRKMESKDL